MRPGEVAIELPAAFDAGVYFIGRIRTPFKSRAECPKNTAQSDAVGRVELDPRYARGPARTSQLYSHVILLYWMDQARRDLIQQVPAYLGHAARHVRAALAGAAQPDRAGGGRARAASRDRR